MPLEVNLHTAPHLKSLSSGLEFLGYHRHGRNFLDSLVGSLFCSYLYVFDIYCPTLKSKSNRIRNSKFKALIHNKNIFCSQDVFPMSDSDASLIASLMPAGALLGGMLHFYSYIF